jgi:hypothetical protein
MEKSMWSIPFLTIGPEQIRDYNLKKEDFYFYTNQEAQLVTEKQSL